MKNACIVGYGAIGPVHADAINKCPDAHLYAVCDIDAERLKKSTDEYSGVIGYTDFDNMLTDDNIDVVHICTPHYLHEPMTKAALAAGKDVVLEKPVCITRGEMQNIINIADRHKDRKLCIMLQNRTNACIVKMKRLAASVETGKLLGIIASLSWHRDEKYYAHDSWRGKWATEGGGLMINQAVHLLDLMIMFGGKPVKVRSNLSHWKISNIEVEDTANALVQFESGICGVFNATNCHSCDSPFYLELDFENVKLRYADGVLYRITDDDITIIEKDVKANIGKKYWGSGHARVTDAFYSSLEGRPSPYTTIYDAADTMSVMFDMYEKGIMEETR